jgi:hypothetical protein
VAAADLEHAVVGTQFEPLDGRCQSFAHRRYENRIDETAAALWSTSGST